jgi:hypothetical protein
LLGLVHVLQGFPERLLFALLGLGIYRRGLVALCLQPVEALAKLPGFPDRPSLGLRRSAMTGYITAVLPRLPFFFICGGRPTGLIGAIFGTFAIIGVFEDFVFGFFDLIVAAIPEL